MTKYKVIKQFPGGPEVGTVLDTRESDGFLKNLYEDYYASPVETMVLLDGGYIEEVDGKWKPDLGEKYWFIGREGTVGWSYWEEDETDKARERFLGIYQTEAEALKARDAIAELLKNL